MNCRRHGSKPTLALWMLVAVADVVLIVATAGVLTLMLVAGGLVTVGMAAWAIRQFLRQDRAAPRNPAPLPTRRRAWADADLTPPLNLTRR